MLISDWSSDVCSSDLCCALRLARVNANLDVDDQPHKSAGFFTGIPSPAGAGVALAPVYLWLVTGLDVFRSPAVTAPVLAATAFLMISNLPTYSWKSIRLPKGWGLTALAGVRLFGGALGSEERSVGKGLVSTFQPGGVRVHI